jgi:hypothetical protein
MICRAKSVGAMLHSINFSCAIKLLFSAVIDGIQFRLMSMIQILPMHHTDMNSIPAVVGYTGFWKPKPIIKDVQLPLRAMMSTNWIPLTICFLAPAILFLLVGGLSTLIYMSSQRERTIFEHFQAQAVLLTLNMIGVLLLWRAVKLVRDFLRYVIVLEVAHDGFTDYPRSQRKVYFDDIEFYNPVYQVKTGQLVAIKFKLKGKPRIMKLPLTLVSNSEPAGSVLLALLEERNLPQKPLYDFTLAGLLALIAIFD